MMLRLGLALVGLVLVVGLGMAARTAQPPGSEQVPTPAPPSNKPPEPCVRFGQAEPHTEQSRLFESTSGWIGADGSYSVPLSPTRTLWLFSDTWVGQVRDGKRTDATIVNNTAAWQDGVGPAAKVEFFVRRDADGKPTALITPADGKGWYWLFGGALAQGRLWLFLAQIERTNDKSVFGFKQIGQWLGIVDNPEDRPVDWRITQKKLTNCFYEPGGSRTFGTAVMPIGTDVYIYGTSEKMLGPVPRRSLIVARAPLARLDEFSTWRYWAGDKGWSEKPEEAHYLTSDMASEGSVSPLPGGRGYVLIYQADFLVPEIMARTAPEPWGPWSRAVKLYRCPEAAWDRRIFCYAAKGHPQLTTETELVISYATNSFDFWHVASDARLYFPHFIRVPIAAPAEGPPPP
ncbi:MAG TPA: DUF4185 domain-containing protein [Gemmatales bacterium]|nr:DUF4185 domain-containing protein [Gemmatales bacterium]HMP59704.1 DUF4185 domain-containing protein [Gemmatales bacterium]